MQKKRMTKTWIVTALGLGIGSMMSVQAATITVVKAGQHKTTPQAVTTVVRAEEAPKHTQRADVDSDNEQTMMPQLPISVAGAFGSIETADEGALVENNEVLVPFTVYEKANLNHIVKAKRGYTVRLQGLRPAGDMLFSNGTGQRAVPLPVVQRNGKEYVNLSRTSSALGVVMQRNKKGILLSPQLGAVEKPVKQALEAPLAWAFDPTATTGTPYKRALTAAGTSIISPSWFQLSHKGTVETTGIPSEEYVMNYTALGYRVWPLITNQFNPTLTHTILSDPGHWDEYVRELAGYALAYGYDGYNFDFENIEFKDKDRLTAFVEHLSKGLQAYNLYTSMDVTGYSNSPNWSLVYDRPALAKSLDYMVLMAYDETWAASPVAGPVASYPWVKRNLERLIKEIPAGKTVLGVPFYMRTWTTPIGADGKPGKASSKTLAMPDSEVIRTTHAKSVTWDDKKGLYHVAFSDTSTENADIRNALKEDIADVVSTYASHPTGATVKNSSGVSSKSLSGLSAKSSSVITVTKETDEEETPFGIVPIQVVRAPAETASKAEGATIAVNKDGVKDDTSETSDIVNAANTSTAVHNSPARNHGSAYMRTDIWFEDSTSLQKKLALVGEEGIAGFAAWRKGFESDSVRDWLYRSYPALAKPVVDTKDSGEKKEATHKNGKKARYGKR